jgi:hypothetical protein
LALAIATILIPTALVSGGSTGLGLGRAAPANLASVRNGRSVSPALRRC